MQHSVQGLSGAFCAALFFGGCGLVFDLAPSDPDAGQSFDARRPCREADDCPADSDPCAGTWTCEAGRCRQGPGPTCDDGLDCTNDECVTNIGCVHRVNCDGEAPGCTEFACDAREGCILTIPECADACQAGRCPNACPEGCGDDEICCRCSGRCCGRDDEECCADCTDGSSRP